MSKTVPIVIAAILLIAVAGGAFYFLGSQPQTQLVSTPKAEQAMQKPEAIMEKPPDVMQKPEAVMEKPSPAVDAMKKDEAMKKDGGVIFKNVDGGQIQLAELNSGKPTLIYFFATWCPVCERDLRNLNSIYAGYEGKINIIVIGFDPSENADLIKQYRANRGYSWPFAEYNKDAILHFKVVTQATKIGLDTKGNEIVRDGYGVLSVSDWTARLDRLLA